MWRIPEFVYIYALKSPNGNVRYVGKTVNPTRRLQQHIYWAKRKLRDDYKDRWIRSLLSQNKTPTLQILEKVAYEQWQQCERDWISLYSSIVGDLTNVAPGGH